MIALVTYTPAVRADNPRVFFVPTGGVAWQLATPERVRELVTRVLPDDTAPGAAGPVAQTWQWVTRTWTPPGKSAVGEQLWDGLTRELERDRSMPRSTSARR
ncbi:hypothetical protein EBO15_38215 [Actinomadura harenae]|uniref:Uncharacterized protein n=1 Tax=Actinomadura harenae TaxID=2483351 RepID=A0A3M2LIK4_9ACTN|nr:hypothetical protein EBO15_38215 [Actinomadura harenae]